MSSPSQAMTILHLGADMLDKCEWSGMESVVAGCGEEGRKIQRWTLRFAVHHALRPPPPSPDPGTKARGR